MSNTTLHRTASKEKDKDKEKHKDKDKDKETDKDKDKDKDIGQANLSQTEHDTEVHLIAVIDID